MSYRDRARPTCPTCEVALEPMQIHRDVWLAPSRLIPQRKPFRYASWTRWSCAQCQRALFELDDLAAILDGVAGDVQRLDRRWTAVDEVRGTCPRCPSTMSAVELYGQRAGRCREHGVWLEPGAIIAMREGVAPAR